MQAPARSARLHRRQSAAKSRIRRYFPLRSRASSDARATIMSFLLWQCIVFSVILDCQRAPPCRHCEMPIAYGFNECVVCAAAMSRELSSMVGSGLALLGEPMKGRCWSRGLERRDLQQLAERNERCIMRILPDAVVPTREELIRYWKAVGNRALKYLARRPLTLVRHVHGLTFFHKGPLPRSRNRFIKSRLRNARAAKVCASGSTTCAACLG